MGRGHLGATAATPALAGGVVDDPSARTAAGAPRSRTRAVAAGILASLGGSAMGMVAPLVVTPLAFGYLGAQRYGLWMAVTSLTSMSLFADLGLGNGLLTRLAALHGTDDRPAAAREVSSAYAMLTGLAAALLAGLALAADLVDWPRVLHVTDPPVAADARALVLVCFGAFLANIPLALVQRVQYAHQQVVQSNLWQAGGAVLSVALVWAAVAGEAPPVLVVAAAVSAVPLANLANSVCYFGWQDPTLRPRWSQVDRRTSAALLRLGLAFFGLSVLTSVGLNIDAFLVNRVLGLEEAANYAVVARLFSVLALVVTLVNLPLWPANGEAMARGDLGWVRRSSRRMMLLSAGAVAMPGLALVAWGNEVLRLWVRSAQLPRASVLLLLALAVWSVLLGAASPLFMVQNSVGLLGPQFVGWSLFLVLSVPLKVALGARFGLPAVPIAAVSAYAVAVLPAAVVGYRRALSAVPALRREVAHV